MPEGFDVAMENFTQNTLRGMSSGGAGGHSNGSITLFKDMELHGQENKNHMPADRMVPAIALVGILANGMRGFSSSIELGNMFSSFSPPTTPIGGSKKIAGMFASKGA